MTCSNLWVTTDWLDVGNPCVPTVSPIYIRHQADITPGQRMRIGATLRFPLQQQFPKIFAGTISYGLEDTNVQDNFTAQQLNDVLFRTGFD